MAHRFEYKEIQTPLRGAARVLNAYDREGWDLVDYTVTGRDTIIPFAAITIRRKR